MSEQPPDDDRLVVETRRFYGEVFGTAWRTVALSSVIVLLIVLFNSDLFALRPTGDDREYVEFTVNPGEGLAFLGVLSAIVIALVVEVDQSARLLSRPDRREMPSEQLGLHTVRLRLAQWTSTALGYGAVLCGLIVVFTGEEVFEARAAFTALAAGLVFAFTLLVNLAAENAQVLLRELNRRATEMMFSRIEYWIGQIPLDHTPMDGWRRALADFWPDSASTPRMAARRLLARLAGLGIGRALLVVSALLLAAMGITAVYFGWGAMTWVAVSGVIWFAVASVGVVLVVRDVFAGARALPSIELLFLSVAGLILSVLVWISSGGTLSEGAFDVGEAGVLVAIVPGVLFAAFAVVAAAWLMLVAAGAYGRRWLTLRVASGLERRGRVLGESLSR